METYHSNFRITMCSLSHPGTHKNSGDKVEISIPNPSLSRHFHHMQQPVLYFQIAVQLLAISLPILGASSFGVFACQYSNKCSFLESQFENVVTQRVMAMAVPCGGHTKEISGRCIMHIMFIGFRQERSVGDIFISWEG